MTLCMVADKSWRKHAPHFACDIVYKNFQRERERISGKKKLNLPLCELLNIIYAISSAPRIFFINVKVEGYFKRMNKKESKFASISAKVHTHSL